MRLRSTALAILIVTLSSLSFAEKKVCIGAISGGDAATWNIQQPLLKAISTGAAAQGTPVETQLLTSGNEKQARGEINSYKCDYTLITNVSREWPVAKDKPGKDDNPHPPSTARFHFLVLDSKAGKIDKFDTTISMEEGYTAKNVDDSLQDIIQQVSQLVLDQLSGQVGK